MTATTKRVALITGGSRGLGLGIAEQLAADGFALAINGKRAWQDVKAVVERLQDLGTEVIYCQAEVADANGRQQMVDQIGSSFGRLDVLVNSADVAPTERADLLNVTEASLEQLIDIHLKGPYFLTQQVARWMIRQRLSDSNFAGVLVNVPSASVDLASIYRGDAGHRGEVAMTRAGVSMATKLWALRLAEHGIQVYEVRPGVFRTDLTDVVPEEVDSRQAEGLTLEARWGEPAELGRAVSLLVSGELSYATGSVLTVDGGMTLPRL